MRRPRYLYAGAAVTQLDGQDVIRVDLDAAFLEPLGERDAREPAGRAQGPEGDVRLDNCHTRTLSLPSDEGNRSSPESL